MHARIDELLSLRDGEPVAAAAARHAGDCPACAGELERLRGLRRRLRALPALPPPERGWEAVARRAYKRSARGRRLLAGAGLGLAASAAWLMVSLTLRETPPAPVAAPPVIAEAGAGANAELMRRSMALEHTLKGIDYQPNVVRASTAGTIADIEDRIALVDYQLSQAAAGSLSDAQSERLWRQRVDLMGSLVQVRYAQVRQAGY
ncbi:MAG TPA: hypothetical protein VM616_05805 [Gammaproteobacteria bacterium]|nr:hypothetical protein [Gammaproteobacteria bacterium]